MNVELWMIGKTDLSYWREAQDEYVRRLTHYLPFSLRIIPDVKNAARLTESQQKDQEGQQILKALQPSDQCILLDEKGTEHTSVGFSVYLSKRLQQPFRRLIFVIGGPYGFSDAVYTRATDRLSVSQMTFSHQMVRVIFLEQLYRSMTIIKGEPYHHE